MAKFTYFKIKHKPDLFEDGNIARDGDRSVKVTFVCRNDSIEDFTGN